MITFLHLGHTYASFDEENKKRYFANIIAFFATPNLVEPFLDSPSGDQLSVSLTSIEPNSITSLQYGQFIRISFPSI